MMTRRRKWLWMTGATVLLVVLGVLAGRVGNVGVRRISTGDTFALTVSEPVVPGVRTSVSWEIPQELTQRSLELRVRDEQQEYVIGQAQLSDQVVTVEFPCTLGSEVVSLRMVAARNGEVLAWEEVTLLPPAQDCF